MSLAAITPGRYLEKVPEGSFVRVGDVPGTRAAASCALSRAAKRGDLVVLRRGLYFKGKRTRYGVARPAPLDVARSILGEEGVGPAGFTAARVFGLTTQVPPVPELAVAGPVPAGMRGVLVHRRNNMRRRDLRYDEVALLEVLRAWDTVSERSWGDLVAAVEGFVRSGALRLDAVARAAKSEPSPDARNRFAELKRSLAPVAA